jgi:Effector-associated domain 11/CHAT domain
MKKEIQELVSNAKLDQAIDMFLDWANDNSSDKELANNLLLLKSRYSSLKRNENLGMIDFQEASRNRAQITNSLLQMLSEADEDGSSKPTATTKGTGNGKMPEPSTPSSTGTGDGNSGKKKILFLASNPSNTGKLQLDKEFRKLYQSLKEGNEMYDLEVEWAITASDLQRVVLKHRPSIIHFSGHGETSKTEKVSGTGSIVKTKTIPAGIVLQDAMGQSHLVSGVALAGLFGICLRKFSIDMVVLNACHSEEQAMAIAKVGISYVVGMNTSVNDETAIEFSTGLYRGIATEGGDYEFAFDLAKNNIMLMGLDGDNIPVLYKK